MTQQPQQTPYIGSKISLISKLDIRYEGILYTVDSQEATIALSKVKSFGTEDRPTPHPVPGRDEVYEYIIFKASDIKDLIVCDTPKPPASMGGLPYDPAILSVSQQPVEPKTQQPSAEDSHGGFYTSQQPQQYYSQNRGSQQASPPMQRPVEPRSHTTSDQHAHSGSYNRQQPQRYYNHSRGERTQARPPMRSNQPREKLKFDSDYDFEKANEQFKETIGDITKDLEAKLKIGGETQKTSSTKSGQRSDENTAEDNEKYYDKSSSFFDSISCEALEKQEGTNTRPDWRKERMTNQETFGSSAVRSLGYRRGGRGYGGPRGMRGGGNQPQQHQQQQRFNNGYVQSYGRQTYTSNNRYRNNSAASNNRGGQQAF